MSLFSPLLLPIHQSTPCSREGEHNLKNEIFLLDSDFNLVNDLMMLKVKQVYNQTL